VPNVIYYSTFYAKGGHLADFQSSDDDTLILVEESWNDLLFVTALKNKEEMRYRRISEK